MQCPPTPGPGVNFMNPNGLVAAASMISQASRPIRSQSSASWLTKAMLMFRKTFSSSFAISAASGEESWTTRSLTRPRSVAARAVASGVVPPTNRGTSFAALSGSPGLTRSGAKARSKSRPASRPVSRSSTSRNGPVVVPGNVVDWRTTSCPARSAGRIVSGGRQARPEVRVLGVRDRRGHADKARLRPPQRGVGGRVALQAGRQGRRQPLVGDVVDRRRGGAQLGHARRAGVGPDDATAGFHERDREREPDVAEADDCDGGVLVHGISLAGQGSGGAGVRGGK